MYTKINSIFLALLLCCSTLYFTLFAEVEVQNTILISIDGVNRSVIYSLIKKNKLPGIQTIVNKGGIYNMEIGQHPSETLESYATILSGYETDLYYPENNHLLIKMPTEMSLFYHLKKEYPNMTTGAIFSMPQNLDQPVRLEPFFEDTLPFIDIYYEEIARKAENIFPLVENFLNKGNRPFFLFINLTDPEYIGHRFREGCYEYSTAIENSDYAIYKIIKALKEKKMWQNTDILITTNYGFKPNTQNHQNQNKTWFASTVKMLKKGSQKDIVPTIYELLKINWREFSPPLKGQPLNY